MIEKGYKAALLALLLPIAIDGPLFAVTYLLTRHDYVESGDFEMEADEKSVGCNSRLSIRPESLFTIRTIASEFHSDVAESVRN